MRQTAALLVSCPDRKGLVSRISNFIYSNGGNILHADQHTDLEAGVFLTRIEFEMDGFQIPREGIAAAFQPIAAECQMRFEVRFSDEVPKTAIFVSGLLHCLQDLLWRQRAGELNTEICMIISNHQDAAELARSYGVKFMHFPITPETRMQQEEAEIRELHSIQIDLIILARYMQILSDRFVAAFSNRIINIHHSFLPAFIGAQPYHQAYSRGVKLIGATSHYVTSELDNGPIIEQEVTRVSHRDSVQDLIRKGRDLEKFVLARGVRLHSLHKILTYGNKTVVFD